MAFRFKKTQSLSENVRRLYKKGTKNVIRALDGPDDLQGIHLARKEIKRLRAVLRLLRPEINDRDCRRVMRPLQKAAKLLGPPRDARVLLETLQELSRRFADALPQQSLAVLGATLIENCAAAHAEFDRNEAARRVCRLLKKSQKSMRKIKLKRSWRSLELGLGKTFGSSRAAFEIAYTEQSPENFHDWRKRVQDVRNQIELLDSRKETSLGEDLKFLSQTLGFDHDIFLLRHFFESHYSTKTQKAKIRPLDQSLRPYEEKLRQSVLTRGTTFYEKQLLGLPGGSSPAALLS